MARNHQQWLDAFRRGRSEMENHLIDGLVDGRIGRREFLRQGSLLGLSLPLLGGIGAAAGFGTMTSPAAAQGTPGATIRVACYVPKAAIDPVKTGDGGGLLMLQQTGEFLCFDGPDLVLQPMLAESWSANDDATVWTFKLRKGVKFHSGGEMTAADVVASMDRLADPENGSNALSVFRGLLQKGGTRKVDDYTVAFHLDQPNGSFPYMVSSDNYNAIILPADYEENYEASFDGTGPFKLDNYRPRVGASFVRNEDYWGEKALPARTEFTFFTDIQPQIIALQSGEVDILNLLPQFASVGLKNNPDVAFHSMRSTSHRQVHMRCDTGPFQDPRVRRAMALCLDRDQMVAGLLKGFGEPGNDSPIAPAYPTVDASVPQRQKNIAEAKALLEAAGHAGGVSTTLTTHQYLEMPAYAQLIQSWGREAGFNIDLNVLDSAAYYGDAVFGKSNWLDSEFGITEYSHRGVPNVFLSASMTSEGSWNAAHFRNADYDRLVKTYIETLDLEERKAAASRIQALLLEETPVMFGYFTSYLQATRKGVTGAQPTAMSQLFLSRASKAA